MNTDTIKACKYKVAKCTLTTEGTSYEINPVAITSILLDHDYDKYCLPYFEITASIANSVYRQIKRENVEVRCYIDIEKTYDSLGMNGEESTPINQLTWEPAIEGNFYCYSDDGTPATNETEIKTYEDSENDDSDTGNQPDLMNSSTVKIALYNEKYLFGIRKTMNKVFLDATSIEACAWICESAGLDNVLCSPATNMDKIPQLIVPPYDAIKALTWVSNNYTMHDCGSLVYFGLNRGYILNRCGTATAWESGEIYRTVIESVQGNSDSYGSVSGCCIFNNENHVNMETNAISFSVPSVVDTQLAGSSMRIVDAGSGSITDVETNATTTDSGKNTKVYTNQVGNVAANAIATRVKEASKQANIAFNCVDFDMFTPNKEIVLSFTDSNLSKYSGSYRPSAVKVALQKDGSFLVPSINVTLLGGYQ